MAKAIRILLLTLGLAAVVACGGGGGTSGGSGAPAGSTQVNVMDFNFKPKDMTVSSGKVVFFLINSGPSAHDMLIADSTGKTLARSSLVQSGDTFTFTVANLAAGKYVFYCDVPGHRASGMEGTLTVT
ncbi:MAG TPA: plastocyanin/azurin family copper-binding protein [Candidatus Dormibacteraeota bacterium]